jgi:hypothetical protein
MLFLEEILSFLCREIGDHWYVRFILYTKTAIHQPDSPTIRLIARWGRTKGGVAQHSYR